MYRTGNGAARQIREQKAHTTERRFGEGPGEQQHGNIAQQLYRIAVQELIGEEAQRVGGAGLERVALAEHLAQQSVEAVALLAPRRIDGLIAAHDRAPFEVAHELAIALHRHQNHASFVFARSGANRAQHLDRLAIIATLEVGRIARHLYLRQRRAEVEVRRALIGRRITDLERQIDDEVHGDEHQCHQRQRADAEARLVGNEQHQLIARISDSSRPASVAKTRMPSASFSTAIASSLSA